MPDPHVIAKPHSAVKTSPDLFHVIAKPDRCEPDLHAVAKHHLLVSAMPDLHVIAPAVSTRGPNIPTDVLLHIVGYVLGYPALVVLSLSTSSPRHLVVVATSCRP
jgi:hypothetical protein